MAEDAKKVRDLLSEYGFIFAGKGKEANDIWFRPGSQCHAVVDPKIKLRHTAEAINKAEQYKRKRMKIW